MEMAAASIDEVLFMKMAKRRIQDRIGLELKALREASGRSYQLFGEEDNFWED